MWKPKLIELRGSSLPISTTEVEVLAFTKDSHYILSLKHLSIHKTKQLYVLYWCDTLIETKMCVQCTRTLEKYLCVDKMRKKMSSTCFHV